jgi:hypothetical protein
MLKRIALMLVAAVFAVPTSGGFAADTREDGVLPDEACHAVYPAPVQAGLCGRGVGGADEQ